MRIDSTASARSICTLESGTRVEVVYELYGWYKIRLPQSAPAFIRKDLTRCIKFTPAAFPQNNPGPGGSDICQSAMVMKDNCNIRLSPNESSPIVGRVNRNEVLSVIRDAGGWYKIEPVLSSFGWINKKFVNRVSAEKKIEAPVPEDSAGPAAQETSVELPREGLVTLVGTVNPYGKVFNRKATHKLVTEKKEVFLLKGDKKMLDALNYHRVKVSGELAGSSRKKNQILEVRITEVLD